LPETLKVIMAFGAVWAYEPKFIKSAKARELNGNFDIMVQFFYKETKCI
jgi:hypothetical protein